MPPVWKTLSCCPSSAELCAACGSPTRDDHVMAGDKAYHEECFVCYVCGELIGNQKFKITDGQPRHAKCSMSESCRCMFRCMRALTAPSYPCQKLRSTSIRRPVPSTRGGGAS